MRGFILAAGFGTRLKPLTDHIPKALVPVCGRSLLAHNLELFDTSGFTAIGVNAHYRSEQLVAFQRQSPVPFELFHESGTIRGTGGAFDFARGFLATEDAFCVGNVDILSNIALGAWKDVFMQAQAPAALVAAPAHDKGSIWVDKETGTFAGVRTRPLKKPDQTYPADFIGVALYRREFLNWVAADDFSITAVWERLAAGGAPIPVFVQRDCHWFDCGTPRALAAVHFDALEGHTTVRPAAGYSIDLERRRAWPADFPAASLGALGDYCWTDSRAVAPDASLQRCVVLHDARVGRAMQFREAVITPWGSVSVDT